MVSLEASRSARGEGWPSEMVFERHALVAALVSLVVVLSVGKLGAGTTADGAIVSVR